MLLSAFLRPSLLMLMLLLICFILIVIVFDVKTKLGQHRHLLADYTGTIGIYKYFFKLSNSNFMCPRMFKKIRLHYGTKPKKEITRTILINNIIEKAKISI